jgi:hypothetical protein
VKPFADSPYVVFCFTGTRYSLVETMDVNSGLYNIPGIPLLGILQRESIETILTHYAQVSKEAMDLIVPKLVGPARITQIFLHEAALLNTLQFKSQLDLKEVSSLLEDTYLWYKKMHGSFFRAIGSGLAKKLSLLYLLPFAFGGECISSSGIVTSIRFESLPPTILEATDSGLIRLEKMESGHLQLYMPYSFMVRFLSECMPLVDPSTYVELSSMMRSTKSFEKLKRKTLGFCFAIEIARGNSTLVKNHFKLSNTSCSIQLLKTIKGCVKSNVYVVADMPEDHSIDKMDIVATLVNGTKLVIQVTTLQNEKEIIEKCMDFIKTYQGSDYQLVFASLHDLDQSFDSTSGIKIWKGKYLVDNCLLPIALLCDPTRGNDALKWLVIYYEEERDKKRRMEE